MGTDYDLTPGQMVGEYRIERKIGEGGFGKVYAAVHPVIGKAAAVKILNPELAKNDEMVSRFVSEARAVNQIRHRNIIDIFAFGTLPGNLHYFVMELLEGSTLDAYLKKQGALSPELALSILWPIGRALVAAHKAGITHRDLKPENVFLTFDQDGGIFPKLLDFGIAKLLHESEIAHRTRTGAMLGTPIYMSPEQCRGSQIDQRSDIYSFGIMIHEVLTGGRPFSGETLMDLLMKQIAEPPPPMSSSRPGLPRSLDAAVLHMLEKMPERRPATMQAALDELAAGARAAGIAVPGSAQQPAPAPAPVTPAAHLETGAWLQSANQSANVGAPAPGGGAPLVTPTGPVQAVTGPAGSYPGQSGPHGQSPVQGQSGPHGQSPVQGQSGPHGQSPVQGQSFAGSPAGQGNMAPAQGWSPAPYGAAPQAMQGYPPAAAPTLQSAGAVPARKPSSAVGIVAAIAAGLFFLFVVGAIGFCAIASDSNAVEIGTQGPSVAEAVDHEATGDLTMIFTPAGAKAPTGSSKLHTHRHFQVTVLAVSEQRALRAEVRYSEAVVQTTGADGKVETESSPVANRTFLVVNSGGALAVSSSDGPVGEKERSEVISDIGAVFKPRPAIFAKELHVGDALTPSSDVVIDLLGLASTEAGTRVRADNATFKLTSIDAGGERATFEVAFLYVYESDSPSLKLSVPLTGTITLDVHSGLPSHGTLNGPVEGAYTDSNARLGVSGTLTMETR